MMRALKVLSASTLVLSLAGLASGAPTRFPERPEEVCVELRLAQDGSVGGICGTRVAVLDALQRLDRQAPEEDIDRLIAALSSPPEADTAPVGLRSTSERTEEPAMCGDQIEESIPDL